jgi:farnesyl-diphosphate farnesyltransferase
MTRPSHVAVAGVLSDGDRVLLCHRRPDRSFYPGVWDLPGGHVEPGEDPRDALVRELREELDITVERPARGSDARLFDESGELELLVWEVERWKGDVSNLAADEHDAVRWMARTNLEPLRLSLPSLADWLNGRTGPAERTTAGPSTVRCAFDIAAQYAWRFEEALVHLPEELAIAVVRAYVCMRALDEIEDHPALGVDFKVALLRAISERLRAGHPPLDPLLAARPELPGVSSRLEEWIALPPAAIAPRIDEAVAAMADRMAGWVGRGWRMDSQGDLDRYCFDVSCCGYILFDDLFGWHSGLARDRRLAVACGREMYLSHIVRHRAHDLSRGVDLYPSGWTDADVIAHARRYEGAMAAYARQDPDGPVQDFLASFLIGRYDLG